MSQSVTIWRNVNVAPYFGLATWTNPWSWTLIYTVARLKSRRQWIARIYWSSQDGRGTCWLVWVWRLFYLDGGGVGDPPLQEATLKGPERQRLPEADYNQVDVTARVGGQGGWLSMRCKWYLLSIFWHGFLHITGCTHDSREILLAGADISSRVMFPFSFVIVGH